MMSAKEDVLKEVGKIVAKDAAKQMAAEMKGGDQLVGAAKELNDTLNEIIAKQSTVKLQVYRVDAYNPTIERYVSDITNINPALLLENGLEATVKAWCGGGKYRIKIQAEGIKEKTQPIEIEGEPLAPVPERMRQGLPPNALLPTGSPGQYTAGPGFAGLLGFANPQPAATDTAASKAMTAMESITGILLAKTLGNADERRSSQESDEMRVLREMVSDLKRDKEMAIAQAQHQRELAELNAKIEKLATVNAQPKGDDTFTKILGLVATALPAVVQAKASSDLAQTQLMTAMLSMNKNDNQGELIKALLAKPDQSDQMLKVYEAMGGMMGTSVQLTQGLINQMASLQGDNRPWWQDAVLQLASSIGDIAQAAMSKSETVKQIGDAEVQDDDDAEDLDDAASAAAAAAQQQLGAPGQPPPQLAGYTGPSRKDPRFAGDFFAKVFSLIEGNVAAAQEIAFRVWKHATSGDVEALAWARDPEGYTGQLLLSFVQRGEMSLTEDRYDAVVAAMVDLHDHFRSGGTPEAYVAHYGIKIAPPKRIQVVPIVQNVVDKEDKEEEDGQPDAAAEPAPAPVAPALEAVPAVVPTPGLDRLPPPPGVAREAAVVPPRAPSPVPSAAESIHEEPKA
jgi:hypothetical protein